MRMFINAALLATLTIFAVSGAWAEVKGGYTGQSHQIVKGASEDDVSSPRARGA